VRQKVPPNIKPSPDGRQMICFQPEAKWPTALYSSRGQ